MTTLRPGTYWYAAEFGPESHVTESVRRESERLGLPSLSPDTGALLRMLAAASQARTVVTTGVAGGSLGLWLLEGMPEDGTLTTIDLDGEPQRIARRAYAALGASTRVRQITGQALTVLPRLADGGYDLVVVDGDVTDYPRACEEAIRLLRPGGVLAVTRMLHEGGNGGVAEPAARDHRTEILRDLGKTLRDDHRLIPVMLPVGDGVLVAVRRTASATAGQDEDSASRPSPRSSL